MSNLHLLLCEVGEISYLTRKSKFECSKAEGKRELLLETINETCKVMEEDLVKWKKCIDGQRRISYSLNHFTMKQILNLRKELAKACAGQVAIDELPLQTFMLLETVNGCTDPALLAEAVNVTIPDNAMFITEKGFQDAQQYFTSGTEDELIMMEIIQDEMHTIQPNTRRMNVIETFMSAKEKLEAMGYDEEYVVAALQDCGRRATEEDIISWVMSDENEENVAVLSEQAKRNPELSDLLEHLFDMEYEVEDSEEKTVEVDQR